MDNRKWYVHVNQHIIRRNIRAERPEPPIRIQRGFSGRPIYGNRVRLPDGATLVYSPHASLLACGARLVIECSSEPEIEG